MPDWVAPSPFILLRVIGALLLFGIVFLFFKREKIDKKDIPRLAVCGLFGVCMNQLLFFHGLNLTSPINASIIMTANPIMVLILASLLIRERVNARKITGVILGAAGAVMLILSGSSELADGGSLLGDTFIFINALSYALYLVLVKPLMNKYKPLTVIFWVFLFGSILVVPFGFQGATTIPWEEMPTDVISGIIYVIIATTFLAYLLNIYALKTVTASVSSSYIYLQPATAMFFAFLAATFFYTTEEGYTDYSGDFNWYKLMCTLMIFIGVYLVSRRVKPKIR